MKPAHPLNLFHLTKPIATLAILKNPIGQRNMTKIENLFFFFFKLNPKLRFDFPYSVSLGNDPGSLRDKIICNLSKTPDLFQEPSQNCPKCGNPVDGHYCHGCALLRKKIKEDLFTYCEENGILQCLLDTSVPSNDNTNVVNALQEPFIVKQDPDGNSFTYDSTSNLVHDSLNDFNPPLQPPPHSCKFCRNDARYGHYCTPNKECSSCGAWYTKSCACSKRGFAGKFVRKTPNSSQRPPQVCAKCENPVDGHYCRHCTLLRKKLKEVWFKICDEQFFFQDFLNTYESSNDDSNVVNAPQEPIVFNQEPREDSSQSPPQIDHLCCFRCGDSLDGVFCRRCTCESFGNGAHIGYNYLPKVSVVSNPKPCHNQNDDELPQTLTNFHPTSYTGDANSSAHDSTPNFVNDSPNVFHPPLQTPTNSYEFCGNDAHYSYDCPPQVPCGSPHENFQCQQVIFYEPCCGNYEGNLIVFPFSKHQRFFLLAWDKVSETKNAVGNKQYKPEDVQELVCKLLNDVQNIHEDLAEYINIPSWNCPTFSSHDDDDDDENYTSPITPEEPENSLSMRDEHLDNIPATKLDEVIKSSVEYLVPTPSEYEGIPDNTCDVLFRDNSSPLDVSEDQFEEFFDSTDDYTSIDDDYFSIDNIDYIELSPPDSELVSLEEVKDDNLHEKLMNINLLIAKIKSLNDNPTPDHVLKSPIPVEDIDSFLEKSDTSLSYLDNYLPEFKTFSNHTEEMNSDSTTTHANYSLPKYDSFLFEIEPDQGELTSVVIMAEPQVHVPNVLTTHPTVMLDSDFIPSDNSLPEFEIFYFDIEEKNSGSTTIHADFSLSDLECFNFKLDLGELTSIVDSGIRENVLSATNVNLPPEDDHSPLFAYVVWIFLSFLTYPVVPPNLLSFGNKDTIFDPDISNYHFSSFMPSVSHRCETFMKFNVYPNHLNESPMEILSSTTFLKDQ
uniref:Uncharacterized protein n=1 Tax=Tanacetum cinerariifolium TaxID=118510 RepID=A0A6L2NHJ7_TANCI|nr:hypothetical protein [Tanacetum cinerariifolium]